MTNIVSGFLITDRMLQDVQEARGGHAMIAHLTQAAYLAAAALFIFSLQLADAPDDRAARRAARASPAWRSRSSARCSTRRS